MLRKRSRSLQKDQQNMGQAHNLTPDESCYQKGSSFFTVPGLFVGLNPKNLESDSVRSPTSPLDLKIFSKPNFGSLPVRGCLKPNEVTQKSWDCDKVGLSLIESLKDETKPSSGKILRSSDSKSVLFGAQMRGLNSPCSKDVKFDSLSNSLPKSSKPKMIDSLAQEEFANFGSRSLDSANHGSNSTHSATRVTVLNPGKDLVASLSASEIELSEDYTCVRRHGPNPKTTHIFGDCILERHDNEFIAKSLNNEELKIIKPSEVMNSYPSDEFLSFCYSCKKKLEGEDIYMYRGEKAFCSWECRSEEILIEEEMENNNRKQNSCEELCETSMFIAA